MKRALFRRGRVGVFKDQQVVHVAPPAQRVPKLMGDLMHWLKTTAEHPLIAGCLFHYELEFIHPFADGNGRMGRLWQTLILSRMAALARLRTRGVGGPGAAGEPITKPCASPTSRPTPPTLSSSCSKPCGIRCINSLPTK